MGRCLFLGAILGVCGLIGCATGSATDAIDASGTPVADGPAIEAGPDGPDDSEPPEEMYASGDVETRDTTNGQDVPMTSMGCDAGDTVCSGICTDLDTDSNNCGKCGNVCTGVCSMGNCCALGEQYCSGACIDTTSDDDNCGMCGMKCTGTDGTCCSSECTNTATDMNNCGMCGMSCSGGTCSASTCIVPCAIPQGSCTHSLCATGGPLTEGCDGDEECTILLCDTESSFGFDPSCCTTAWTSECVSEVESFYVSSFGGCL